MLSHPLTLTPLLASAVHLKALLKRGRRLEGAVLERGLNTCDEMIVFQMRRLTVEHVQRITIWVCII